MVKILHLTFHNGSADELEYICKELNFYLETVFFNDYTKGKYNIGHDRAQKYWDKNKDYFENFDIIITSDTAPLSRIFLQNNWNKKLIIWINNRFDYYDAASLDCDFPDKEYYELIQKAVNMDNVYIYGYTKFENFYCKLKNIDIGKNIIKPIGLKNYKSDNFTNIKNINEFFFVGSYHNDNIMINLKLKLIELDLKIYNGKYYGPNDLKRFKAVIHIPYAWSNYSIFEAFQYSIIYFIPSENFFKELKINRDFFWSPPYSDKNLKLSEWYNDEYKDFFVYFNSWEDLKQKINIINYEKLKNKLKDFGKQHKYDTLKIWNDIIKN